MCNVFSCFGNHPIRTGVKDGVESNKGWALNNNDRDQKMSTAKKCVKKYSISNYQPRPVATLSGRVNTGK